MRIRLAGFLLCLLPLATSAQSLSEQVVELVNIERWTRGQLAPLKHNPLLELAAAGHSTRMGTNNFFMHCDPDSGKAFTTRISEAGYSWSSASENIAAGSSTALGVMTQWINSQGHRNNILSNSNNEIGVGYYFDASDTGNVRSTSGGCTPTVMQGGPYRHYWTQNFGQRSGAVLLVAAREAYRVTTCAADLYTHAGGVSQMRFSNDGSNWSAWEAFANNKIWTLAGAANTTATVRVQVRSGSNGAAVTATDTVRLAINCGSTDLPVPAGRIFTGSFE